MQTHLLVLAFIAVCAMVYLTEPVAHFGRQECTQEQATAQRNKDNPLYFVPLYLEDQCKAYGITFTN